LPHRGSVGRLPVVDPRDAETIVGIITCADIGRAIERSPLQVHEMRSIASDEMPRAEEEYASLILSSRT
jgi:predicted transcriptional regulator